MNRSQNVVVLVGALEADPTKHDGSATARINLTETIRCKSYPAFAFLKAEDPDAISSLMGLNKGDIVIVEGKLIKSQHYTLNQVVLAHKIERCG